MTIRNNTAAFAWGFALVFLLMCVLFTYLAWRDGVANVAINPPTNQNTYPPLFIVGLLAAFWLAGLAVALQVAAKPCVAVQIRPDHSLSMVSRYPFRKEVRHFPRAQLRAAEVIARKDDEGDPYFEAVIQSTDGVKILISEGHSHDHCEAVCARVNAALGFVG